MIEPLTEWQVITAAAIIAVAYFVRGVAGFGSGLIATPLLALSMPLHVVVPVVVTLDYIASAGQGIGNRNAIAWREIWPLLPFSLAGTVLALHLFRRAEADTLKQTMAIFIIVYAVYTFAVKTLPRGRSCWWSVPCGGFGGLFGTLFGTGGPFYAIYLNLRGLDKGSFRATFATIFLLDGTGRLVGYAVSGFVTTDLMLIVAGSLPVALTALYAGGHVHTAIGQETFRRAIGILLIGSGLALLFK